MRERRAAAMIRRDAALMRAPRVAARHVYADEPRRGAPPCRDAAMRGAHIRRPRRHALILMLPLPLAMPPYDCITLDAALFRPPCFRRCCHAY